MAKTKPQTTKPKGDPKAAWKQRVYADPVLWTLFKSACNVLGKSPSGLISEMVRRELKKKAPALKLRGLKVPEAIFEGGR